MKSVFIKPTITDVGRGPEPCRLRYKRDGVFYELPESGAFVPSSGEEGSFWKRRVSEGCAEKAEAPARGRPRLKVRPRSRINKDKIKAARERAEAAKKSQAEVKAKAEAAKKKPQPAKEG